jgi:hypothetical protein
MCMNMYVPQLLKIIYIFMRNKKKINERKKLKKLLFFSIFIFFKPAHATIFPCSLLAYSLKFLFKLVSYSLNLALFLL